MPDTPPRPRVLGYCTNVHAGDTYERMLAGLERHALTVKRILCPREPMPIGLWLSAQAARQVLAEDRLAHLRDWLTEHGLEVFMLNGFPFGNFHSEVVKHRVYEPDWRQPERLRYTRDLIAILAELLPEGGEGSISTLPLGWRGAMADDAAMAQAAAPLLDLMHHLARVELDTGRLIHIDLEPEPGCVLDEARGVVDFFHKHLFDHVDALSAQAYLRVCHDVCHAAVMFEDQAQVLRAYRQAGIRVGKVQISSALRVAWDELDEAGRTEALKQLSAMDEPRYLHQTVTRARDGELVFHDDLPAAMAAAADSAPPREEWRVHFHVPIFADRLGLLSTTQGDIVRCIEAIEPEDEVHHFEVETYAWGVLPPRWRAADLAEGIAREITWAVERLGFASKGALR